jgi:hypothetical protein
VQIAPSNVPYVPVSQVGSTVTIQTGKGSGATGKPASNGTIPKISQTTSSGPVMVTANAAADMRWSAAAGLMALLGFVAV